MTRLGILAFLVACSHSDAPPPVQPTRSTAVAQPAADPAPCPDVAAQTVKLMPGSDEVKPVIERHCVADAWSVELRKCMLLAKTQDELQPCQQHFAGTQLESLQRDVGARKPADTTAAPVAPAAQPVAPTPTPDVPPPANAMPK